ncbi:uncharacterized protein LOC120195059 [Hibiscus syriacus]|uniref:uncharacterized protein LOC120195059 n=1 Tax=Hibiscus syriacus TaxID=106335 RepID=UPI00192325E5|nr:uncharacterized protein LOC120195059 [Hibiscus syriacus]
MVLDVSFPSSLLLISWFSSSSSSSSSVVISDCGKDPKHRKSKRMDCRHVKNCMIFLKAKWLHPTWSLVNSFNLFHDDCQLLHEFVLDLTLICPAHVTLGEVGSVISDPICLFLSHRRWLAWPPRPFLVLDFLRRRCWWRLLGSDGLAGLLTCFGCRDRPFYGATTGHRGASELQRMVRTRNGGVTSSHRGVEQEVTEPVAPRMVRTRNGGSTSSHRGVEQEATEPVVQETGSVDRRKLEEIEAALAALRAHMISCDRMMRRVEETQEDLLETVTDLGNEARDAIGVIQLGYDELKAQVSVLQAAVASLTVNPIERVGTRAKIPDPQRFDGVRDAKELENFLFDIEQYFRAMRTESEEDKVAMASMYLGGDAKLWWRSKFKDGVCSITTWDALKKELKTSFLPENVDYNAHKKLRELSHTGTIREYVREFSTLMLDIKDISERDKLFHFLEGLKPWARLELQRQKVQDLTIAIAAAECLNDYNDHPGKRKTPSVSGANTQQVSGNKLARGEKTSSWGANRRVPGRDPAQNKVPTGPGSSNGGNRPSLRCFLCNGPHRVTECPQRSAFNAMVATTKDGERVNAPMGDTEPEPARMGSIRFITALQSQLSNLRKEPERGLMYVDISVNGKTSKALVDTGATDTFISPEEAERCKLIVTKEVGQMKAVNSATSMICGGVKRVSIKLGSWEGSVDFTVSHMDDFDVVLGLDFMMASQVIPVPASSCLMFMGEQPCVVPATILPRPGKKILSAIQFKRGVKKGEPSFLVFPISKEDDNLGMVPRNVKEVLRDFEDVMPGELTKELPPRRLVDHEIELIPGVKPPAKCPYRMSPPELAELRKQLDELLQAGFIRPSKSPFGAPVLFQRKHDGSLRLCVDYRALNKVTVRNKYPIPLIVDLLDQLSNAKYFTKLDLRSGYHQVRVAEGDEPKTTCVTRYGAFEFLVMRFGLTNAPATFCILMNQVFHDYLDKFVVIYLDDIMIFSNSIEEHLEHLRLVLTRLRENRLFVKKEKCAFAQTQVQFLGHIIERGRIRMDKEKVKAIQEWPTPQNVSELRSFLGLANYYRRFVEGYSRRVKLLTDLLKKGCEWVWSKDCQEAFDDLKKVVISEPVLTFPDLEKPIVVKRDASDYAIGGVLLQDKHPVAFESRKLNETEARYTAPEKELLVVIHCLRIWRHYLLGSKFVVKTDNTVVSHFLTQPKLTAKQARWQEFLAEFDFNFEHKVGNASYKVDPPTWMRVHPVFHVSNLKPFHTDPNIDNQSMSARESIGTQPPSQRHVDEILAGRIVKVGGKQRREYLVKWGGFDQEENTWEREYDLRAFKQQIEEFQAKQSTRTSTN